MICFLRKNAKFFLFFLMTLFILLFLIPQYLRYDAIWEYGFAHAIKIGEIPYKDFNTVTTPLFIYLFSVGLFIKDTFIVYLVEFAFLYTIMFYFANKLLGDRVYYFVIAMLIFINSFIPSYNALSFALIVIIMALEREKKDSFLIGVVLALLVLSKHTIGGVVFFLSLLTNLNKKYIIKKSIGFLIPCSIFLLFLLLTDTFMQFFDLCILGLFDFSKNTVVNPILVIIVISIIMLNIYLLYKKKIDRVLFFYSLSSIAFLMPICDFSHFSYFFPISIMPILDIIPFKKFKKQILFLICILLLGYFVSNINNYKAYVFSDKNHFEKLLICKNDSKYIDSFLKEFEQYKDKDYYIYDYKGMYLDIILDHNISYYSMPLTGNYGYNGNSKMKNRISKLHDVYFLIDYNNYVYTKNIKKEYDQLDLEIIEYIFDNSEKIDNIGYYTVYYIK